MLRRALDLPADTLLALAARWPERYPVLFDSASSGPLARHSVLATTDGGSLAMARDGTIWRDGRPAPAIDAGHDFLGALEADWRRVAGPAGASAGAASPDLAPWRGGYAVFLGYELAAQIEPSLRLAASPDAWVAWALRTPAALVLDVRSGRIWACAEPGGEAWLDRLERDARDAAATPARFDPLPPWQVDEEPEAPFLDGVRRALGHIAAGDVYQLNLSRGWSAALPSQPLPGIVARLYGALRRANPAPFAVLAQWGGQALLSSSPERLLCVEAGVASTRPIAGTRPRGSSQAADAALAAELHVNAKERAEHVMLIDLERNDLGRVCAAGTVAVSEFMAIESYAHVHHIVSEVSGTLRPDANAIDALRALFPGGTITGCPKVRCMQLIGELEQQGRGAYTGSLGMLGIDGSADFNILIRTMTLRDGRAHWRAGAGIVADSQPEAELAETRAKARGLVRALLASSEPA